MAASKRKHPEEGRVICAGLDIGTTKIAAVIAEVRDGDRVLVIGAGLAPAKGMRQGVVIHFEEAVESVGAAIREAQLTAGVEMRDAYIGIAGDHIHSVNSRGVVAVSGSDKQISEEDRERVLSAARAIALPTERKVIHVLPQEYFVDNQSGIKNPVGLSGVRLEAEVHIVTCTAAMAQNILRCVGEAGLHPQALVLEPLASSYAVLEPDEKKLGIILIDIGGGTTDVAMFYGDAIRHTAVAPLGGQNVTNDVAIGLKTSIEDAEEIKKKYGCAFKALVDKNETFRTASYGGRGPKEITRDVLVEIIQPRMEEIYGLVLKEIKRSDYGDRMDAGVVLTGGGALLPGAVNLAEEVFGMPVRLGLPKGISGLTESVSSPIFATGIGLVLYGLESERSDAFAGAGGGPFGPGWWGRLWNRFRKEFY